ncbi:hypothetical protein KFZ70_03675 [Tamlana fucoidanivorans]|uniref:Uncharacterized protein n=1 Tax=Allotamlana fucoidanivorans TaxID=2583814 RepID=A0A5C4SJW4_9FLAO|nr:hypothetical protein [Tamlana fucoidanivorans]TNJ44207.1 hypothetical protein FGF67_09245 [Tamlana fucoidanivorans]
MKKFSLFIYILAGIMSFSQSKNEREVRVKPSEFPEVTSTYFNNFIKELKYLKFYRETDGDKVSYETKLKTQGFHFSIEFDTLGKLEDIEIVIKEKHIPKTIKAKIGGYFETHYNHVRFIKIQKQFVNSGMKPDKQFIQMVVENPNKMPDNFEIIAETKKKKDRQLSEFTFRSNGQFIKARHVTSSSYSHALY